MGGDLTKCGAHTSADYRKATERLQDQEDYGKTTSRLWEPREDYGQLNFCPWRAAMNSHGEPHSEVAGHKSPPE